MGFRFEHHDPGQFRRKSRLMAVVVTGQFIVLGVLFSQVLTARFGSSLGMNALGVLLGLLTTSVVVAVLRERPWLADQRYAWELKHHLARVSAHLSTLRDAGLERHDPRALDLLAFYHQGMQQLAELNGRTPDDDSERLAERLRVRRVRESLNMPVEVDGLDPGTLKAFREA
ncbi:Protein of unknown function [Modicisalibacter ilicicola DSM 19980]|uniref:DUF3087 domain-containing protein n=1 Tax=Modicisalibacter ilicicola DSM 19980 TaxID=1121942 RepID=A0A1M4V3W9_9GAMM|nr:DUF3087 family protein [Halomonas ilicicola]SHE63684.1 Protein of unknown function [Halomonas ilicicola DSM 19980]